MNAINEFWVDYKDMVKETNRFYKKHWKGVIIANVAVVAISFTPYLVVGAVDKIKSKRNAKEVDENLEEIES